MSVLPDVPGIVFAYDVRRGVMLEPLEEQAIGQFDFAVDMVAGVKGPLLERRRSGVDPYRALQVPFNPSAGYNGFPGAYAPAFDMLAAQQTSLQSLDFDSITLSDSDTFNASFVIVAAMRAATVTEARLMGYYGMGDSAATDDGLSSAAIFTRDGLNNAIRTVRYAYTNPAITTPINLDQLYRFGATFDETSNTQYIDGVVSGVAPAALTPLRAMGRIALGGPANTFQGHNAQAWDGPILFAMGANVTWSAAELAKVDAWIVEEFNL